LAAWLGSTHEGLKKGHGRSMTRLKVAIIGAGVSGAAVAHLLHREAEIVIFEKSRGLGGRLSTRRIDGLGSFDHGAQFFTCRSAAFEAVLRKPIQDGQIVPWDAPLVRIDAVTGEREAATPGPRYVGVGKAATLVQSLLSGTQLALRLETEVARVIWREGLWRLIGKTGDDLGAFHMLVVTTPPHQAASLLEGEANDGALVQRLRTIQMDPCWCVMLHWSTVGRETFGGAFVKNSPIAWIARNDRKPGRSQASGELWTVHATGPWSAGWSKEEKVHVERQLKEAMQQLVGRSDEPAWVQSHYWRYAQAVDAQPEPFYWQESQRLGLAGDWFPGARVEGAFLSGWHLGQQLLRACQEARGAALG
jgi:predicted NAD/FAD-dependent oxidoreductase